MKIGIDGRAAKWYRGTGIGTYTYQLINNLSIVDSSNQYLILLPQNTDLVLRSLQIIIFGMMLKLLIS